MKNKKNVPDIRFKGFIEKWKFLNLENLVELFSGLTYSPTSIRNEGTLVLRSSNVKDGIIVNADNVYVASEFVNSDYVVFGDIIVVVRNGSRSLIGKHAMVDRTMNNTVIGAFMTGLRYKQPEFLNALLYTKQFDSEIAKNLGATINQITNGALKSMSFTIPQGIDEQQAIGNYFQNIDRLINTSQTKLDKLKNIKKACLEKMFPRNGSTTPELRFKGFSEEWEILKIKEICSITTGKSNTQDQVEDGAYPFFIRSDKAVRSNRYLYDCEAVLTIGDGNIGKVFHYVNGKFDLHQRVYKMDNFINILGKYFYYYFSTMFYERAMSMTAKATVDSIRLEMISEMNIMMPISLDEQSKIAGLFSELDSLIAKTEQQINKLKNIKKACLDKMFVNE